MFSCTPLKGEISAKIRCTILHRSVCFFCCTLAHSKHGMHSSTPCNPTGLLCSEFQFGQIDQTWCDNWWVRCVLLLRIFRRIAHMVIPSVSGFVIILFSVLKTYSSCSGHMLLDKIIQFFAVLFVWYCVGSQSFTVSSYRLRSCHCSGRWLC